MKKNQPSPLRKADPKRYCRNCEKPLVRKVQANGIESHHDFCRRAFCDRICMSAGKLKNVVSRSAYYWRARKFRGCKCDRCGNNKSSHERGLHTHHRNKDITDNRPENLETVCDRCHGKEHGKERGDLFASRCRIDKSLLAEMWIVIKEAAARELESDPFSPFMDRIEDLLHRGGQL